MLVKPQFEAGRVEVSTGRGHRPGDRRVVEEVGTGRDPSLSGYDRVDRVAGAGSDGDREFFVHAAVRAARGSVACEPGADDRLRWAEFDP